MTGMPGASVSGVGNHESSTVKPDANLTPWTTGGTTCPLAGASAMVAVVSVVAVDVGLAAEAVGGRDRTFGPFEP